HQKSSHARRRTRDLSCEIIAAGAGARARDPDARSARAEERRRRGVRPEAEIELGLPHAVGDPIARAVAVVVDEPRVALREVQLAEPDLGELLVREVDDRVEPAVAGRAELGLVADADADQALLGDGLREGGAVDPRAERRA